MTRITGIELDGIPYDLAADGTLTVRSVPDPDPDPGQMPTVARVDGAKHRLDGVNPVPAMNPVGAGYPGCRGPDQLVAYVRPVMVTQTNRWGVEAAVSADGVVVDLVDKPVPMSKPGGIGVPPGGFVLSGHGAAGEWLKAHARRGVRAVMETGGWDADPPAAPGRHQLSVYLKMWKSSRLPGLAAAAVPGITEVRLAFLQGSPPALVGWGSQDEATVVRDAVALRARGVAVTGSIGGEDGRVDTSSLDLFVLGVTGLHRKIGLDRVDWDVEASALRADDVIRIAERLHTWYKTTSTMTPSGSNVGTYLPVAVEMHKRGILAAYGQQFYDSHVPLGVANPDETGTAMGRIAQAVQDGLPPSVIQVGMMVGDDSDHWSMDVCESNMAAIKAEWPDIGGAYLWSETHGEVAEWARRIGAVLG